MGVGLGHHILGIVGGRAGSMQTPGSLGRPEGFTTGPSKSWSLQPGASACVSRGAAGCEMRFLGLELARFETLMAGGAKSAVVNTIPQHQQSLSTPFALCHRTQR